MTNEKESGEMTSKESDENECRKQVPVEIHNIRCENSSAISEASVESVNS